MTKWDYIAAISRRGDSHGRHGGIADLLDYYNRASTRDITKEEAAAFLEIDYKEAQT